MHDPGDAQIEQEDLPPGVGETLLEMERLLWCGRNMTLEEMAQALAGQ